MCRKGLGLRVGKKKSLGRGLALFNRAKCGFQPFGELLTPITGNPFDPLFNPTIGSNREADGALGHSSMS